MTFAAQIRENTADARDLIASLNAARQRIKELEEELEGSQKENDLLRVMVRRLSEALDYPERVA